MRKIEQIWISVADRERLERLVRDRNTPQKVVWRARIVLLASDGLTAEGIAAAVDKSLLTVRRWRRRYEIYHGILNSNILTHKSPCEPNPSPRPHSTGIAHEEGACRYHYPRLQAQRHHHPVRSAEHAGWQGYRDLHVAPSTSRVPALSQIDRPADPRRSRSPSHR